MKPLLKFFLIAILFTATNTFASEIQDRKLSGFRAVASTGSFDVVLRQGGSESVKVEADAEVINDIVTEVKNGTLTIRSKNTRNWSNMWNNRKITIYVVAKDLNSVSLSGSGDLKIENQFNANKLELRLSGSGDFRGAVNVKTLEASISGSGDFSISGKADESTVSISGSGDYHGSDLMTKSTAIRVSGSGDATIYASENVEASVSGSGDVHYSGHPKNVSKVAHGSGDISGS
ncbi:MAG: head GIN domain-containing protein [Janthinobacterium lividum]